MKRTLKVVMLAAMAVAAFGAISAAGAQAAQFHCSVENCTSTTKADGTAKNSHHVFIVTQGVASAATTCASLKGESTGNPQTTETMTLSNITYSECNVAGAPSTVKMNGCDYLFHSNGEVDVKCPEGSKIVIEVTETGCQFSIGAQNGLNKVSYATIGTAPNREVTVSTNVTGVAGSANAKCAGVGIAEGAVSGDYTTGNTIVTGETSGGVMADAWFE
jgi:hypothetical protein